MSTARDLTLHVCAGRTRCSSRTPPSSSIRPAPPRAGDVGPNDSLSFFGQLADGLLGRSVVIAVDGFLNGEIDTSCSQPIFLGLVAGDFEIVAGTSLAGGTLGLGDRAPGGSARGEVWPPNAIPYIVPGFRGEETPLSRVAAGSHS